MPSTLVSEKNALGCISIIPLIYTCQDVIEIYLTRCNHLNMTKSVETVEVWLGSDLLKRLRVLSLGNNRVMKESIQTSDPLWATLAAFVYSIFRNKVFSC